MRDIQSDAELTYEVQRRLEAHDDVRAEHVDITVRNRVVTLVGEVHDERSRDEARRIAGAVPGVLDVEDQLTVTNGEPASESPAAPRDESNAFDVHPNDPEAP